MGWGIGDFGSTAGLAAREAENLTREAPRPDSSVSTFQVEGAAAVTGSGPAGSPFGVSTTSPLADSVLGPGRLRRVWLLVSGSEPFTGTINGLWDFDQDTPADFTLPPTAGIADIDIVVTGSGTYTATGWIDR